jgi:hypothetical protein
MHFLPSHNSRYWIILEFFDLDDFNYKLADEEDDEEIIENPDDL